MNKFKRFIALALVLCMVFAYVPAGVSAASEDFLRVYHVDCGRKYFTVAQIQAIIDQLAENGYTHLELAIGNEGLRFILDDMSVTANGTTYSSEDVAAGIRAGNKAYSHSGEWSQAEMDEIIAYANSKGIEVIPLLNSPGHMNAILDAMEDLGLGECGYSTTSSSWWGSSTTETSERTVDVTNKEALAFTLALVGKYVAYFDGKGCSYFNLGADEYANDILADESGLGFGYIQTQGHYDEFVNYVNDVAQVIVDAGMTPIAFNDGLYYAEDTTVPLNENVMVAYWSAGGWGGLKNASASFIASQGHDILNTNELWYYVLGRYEADNGTYSYEDAVTNTQSTPVTDIQGSGDPTPAGAMMCLWCDDPSVAFGDTAMEEVTGLIGNLADSNSGYFVVETEPEVPETTEPEETEPETSEPATKTDEDTGVSVEAPGLTGLTVTDTTAPAIEGTGEVVAYDVVPETAEGSYTGEATVSIPVPAGWTNVRGGVLASAGGEEVLNIIGKLENGKFTFTAPHFSTVVAYDVAETAEGETVDGGDIILNAEAQATKTISGANYSSDYEVADSSVVSVEVTGQDAVEATVKYTAASVTCNNLISNNSTQVATGYYYTPDNGANYYPVYASRKSERGWFSTTYTYTWYYSTDNGSTFSQIGTQETTSTSTTANITVYTKSGTEGSPASTTITFTGLKPGTTTVTVGNYVYDVTVNYNEKTVTLVKDSTISFTQSAAITDDPVYSVSGIVTAEISGNTVTFTGIKAGTTVATVGNTKYTINVTEENLSAVADLQIEWWITNLPVISTDDNITASGSNSYVDDNNATKQIYYTAITATAAYGAQGIEVSTVVPSTGTSNDNNIVCYWKGVALSEGSEQTLAGGRNQSMSGTDFYYIRYYGGAWEISEDRANWTKLETDRDGSFSGQLVAYYLQATEVTDEVDTMVVDWGVIPSTSYNSTNFILVDYAVKYETGELEPDAFPVQGKTQAFHCDPNDTNTVHQYNGGSSSTWSNNYREIGMIKANETAEYEVYMITLTPTSDSRTTQVAGNANSATSYTYGGTEKVVWVDDEANLGEFAGDDKKFTSISGAITYSVGGEPIVPGLEIFNRHGMLVTYYVRAKATEDALTVHYIDATEGANNLEFYSYNIAVQEGTYFNAGIALNTANPNGDLVNGTVTNYHGRSQTVSADLSTLSQVGAQYLYTEYECIRVERSEDGKHVYLYYTFDPTVYFVADFGLPMEITATDLSDKLDGVTIKDMSFTGVNYSAYGRLTDNGTTVTYAPYKILNGIDYFTLIVTTESAVGGILDEASTQIAFRVYVIPATTVYYEESFATATNGTWTASGTANAGDQETELARNNNKVNYGCTGAYTAAGMTNGTELVSSAAGNKAEISFTGTGIEIYANAKTTTGTVAVLLYHGQNENGTDKLQKLYQVDTAAASGTTTATDGQNVDSYSLPIVSITGLEHSTYKVVLQHTGAGHDLGDIRLDGFRVHNTIGNLESIAYADSEKNPAFLEVRDAVLTGLNVTPAAVDSVYETADTILSQVYNAAGSTEGALYLSNATAEQIADLLDNGPKNELFLWPGESVTFNLGDATAQVGLKALNKTTTYSITDGTVDAEPTTGSISTSADMFYHDLTGTIVITNTGSNVLSVTKLKLFGASQLQPLTVEDVAYALSVIGYTDGNPMPGRPGAPIANPFEDVTEDAWYYDSVLWAVEKGITTGADATHFLPNAMCQRAAVVTFLWRAAGSPEPVSGVNPFVDVQEDTFFYKAVLWAVENGITNGSDATHFNPYGVCGRAQVVTFLWRANGQSETAAEIPFADVAEGQWYTQAVAWAVANGVTNGMSATEFGVNAACNRAQIVTFLYRASLIAE